MTVDVNEQQIIDEKQLSVDAGNLVAKIYNELVTAYSLHADINDSKIQKSLNMLIVRLVFLLYADDTGVLGRENMFQEFMERREPQDIRSALIDLFKVLDEDPEKGERSGFLSPEYLQFKYVNGGMFKDENIVIPQFTQSLKDLIVNEASKGFNWANISPTIFGAVFESTLNPATRRSGGMHYTSIENIHKVIDPLFLDDLRSAFNKIQDMANVNQRVSAALEFQDKIANLKFFDPACGSGNFLTETYLSLRRLENECLKIIVGNRAIISLGNQNPTKVKVRIQNFYGIEINDFAVSVARTAMWIAESQMWDESQNIIYSNEDFLPLDSNDSIYEGNALRMDWTDIVKPYELNYIMGNPPFIGYSHQSKEQKEEQAHIYSDQGKQIGSAKKNDYVSNWYMKAANYINGTTIRCAFVSTNSIVQGAQVTSVWQPIIAKYPIVINFAYTSFSWNNEAKNKAHVHVVIIGFSDKKAETTNKYIYNHNNEAKSVSAIGYYLTEGIYPFLSLASSPISPETPTINNGNRPTDHGFLLLDPDEAKVIIRNDPAASQYIKRLYGSREFINNKERYCIWLKDASPKVIREHKDIIERVEKVKEFRLNSTKAATRKSADTPWLFQEIRQPESGHYLVLPVTTSQRRDYIPVGFLSSNEISTNALMISTEPASLYDFGVIESSVHMAWMRTVTGRMKSDYQYSKELVYNDFAWPSKTKQSIDAITKTAQAILDARKFYPDSSLADLYDPLTMPAELRKAHKANDKAVLKAYGIKSSATEAEIVQHLFGMYEDLVRKDKQ